LAGGQREKRGGGIHLFGEEGADIPENSLVFREIWLAYC